jgi:hypothetical protein
VFWCAYICSNVMFQEADEGGDLEAYAEVLAILDDGFGEGMHVEVRWFLRPREVLAFRRKRCDNIAEIANACADSPV